MYCNKTLEQAREIFKKDVFATEQAGIEIDAVSIGYAKCSMKITPKHFNAGGKVMGGAIFTLADFALGVAANCERSLSVTLSAQIYFLGSTKGSVLYAEARVVRQGGKIGVYEIDVYDDLGAKIAKATSESFTI
ncbi:MAG: PaaI family thioesterase [Clostridia bacterium]|nr:PaaI family thioesterase [Clostridia bacterium]